MIKGHGNVRKRNGNGIRRLKKLKVYRDEVTASAQYTFLMSNLEGLRGFIRFFVNILLL